MCPVCNERHLGIGKPMCLACWRFVPVRIQDALHAARRKYDRNPHNQAVLAVVLNELIAEAIEAARVAKMSLEVDHAAFKAREELANQRARAREARAT